MTLDIKLKIKLVDEELDFIDFWLEDVSKILSRPLDDYSLKLTKRYLLGCSLHLNRIRKSLLQICNEEAPSKD